MTILLASLIDRVFNARLYGARINCQRVSRLEMIDFVRMKL